MDEPLSTRAPAPMATGRGRTGSTGRIEGADGADGAGARRAGASLGTLGVAALMAVLAAGAAGAQTTVEREFALAASGSLDIVNVQGQVEVHGWAQDRVRLVARLEGDADALKVSEDGTHGEIRVEAKRNWFGRDVAFDADLRLDVPAGLRLQISTVSADVSIADHAGEERVQSVSGDLTVETTSRDVDLESVSGNIVFRGAGTRGRYHFNAVSGDADLRGVAGDLRVNTISGDAEVEGGALDDVGLESVSGTLRLLGTLAGDGRLRAGSVSGDITLTLCERGNVEFDLESFSGDIVDRVTNRAPDESRFGPGARLRFTEGDGDRRARVNTMSGNIEIRACR